MIQREHIGELSQHDLNRVALECLIVDNPELEQLETSLDQFNVFEALGAVRQELRHSCFLAFYLIPKKTMGWAMNLQNVYCRRY